MPPLFFWKECVDVIHSKYYAYSVFLAVLVSCCCLILFRPAEADAAVTADGTYYPDIMAIKTSFEDLRTLALDTCEYFFVLKTNDTTYQLGFIDSDTIDDIGYLWTRDSTLGFYYSHLFNLYFDVYWQIGSVFGGGSGQKDFVPIGSKDSGFNLIGTNFPLYEYYLVATGGVELPQENLSFPGSGGGDVLTVPLLDTYVDVPMGSYKYYLVLYDANKYDSDAVENYTRVFLSDEPLQGVVENGAVTLRADKKIIAYGMDTNKSSAVEYLASSSVYHSSTTALCTNGYSDYASNYNLSYNNKVYLPEKPYVKVTPTPTPVPELTYRYDSSAAVPVISGYAKNQYPNGNGVGTIYIDGTDFRNVYNSGQFGGDAKPRVYVDYTVEIAFPSVDYVNRLLTSKEVAGALDGIGIIEGSEDFMLSRSVYTNWLSSLGKDGNAEYYTVSGRYSYIHYTDFKNRGVFKFSPDDALSSRFSSTQALKDYYRLTDKEWKAVGKYVVLFATPVSCTARLGYRVSDTEYVYGDTSTVIFSTDSSGKTLVSSVVPGDVITDADIRRENDFILKKYAMESGSVIGSVSDVSGAFENLGGSDIWATFKSATTGLMTMASSVSHIAVAIGAVFSFLPGGVYNLMYLTLMIVLVCAIIKAIRG